MHGQQNIKFRIKKFGGELQINFPTKMEVRNVTARNTNEGYFDINVLKGT
jgi:acetamidase/formamidase